ncbi:hypothetical protein POM88_033240 [Heracleum sosnowskyi]|uniref:Enolpyruvate transferase domain-containing protein n=1 Tax=Heracleum sosnowskyi TaxID=360622 RepID=A0AAD8I0T8_9APIA|nr:hypothetical protein POM88_033240 [Heracleum sosnowskyi]
MTHMFFLYKQQVGPADYKNDDEGKSEDYNNKRNRRAFMEEKETRLQKVVYIRFQSNKQVGSRIIRNEEAIRKWKKDEMEALREQLEPPMQLLHQTTIHLQALRKPQVEEEDSASKRAIVEGSSGLFPAGKESKDEIQLFLGNAGTTMRPLTAAVIVAGGNSSYILDGVPRMRERPIGDLVTAGKGGLPGGKDKLSGSVSSQYLTALLMAAPLAVGDI